MKDADKNKDKDRPLDYTSHISALAFTTHIVKHRIIKYSHV